jgi:hypothetical protein
MRRSSAPRIRTEIGCLTNLVRTRFLASWGDQRRGVHQSWKIESLSGPWKLADSGRKLHGLATRSHRSDILAISGEEQGTS